MNIGFCEHRLMQKGDIGQLIEDTNQFHVRGDSARRFAGSLIMAPAVAITKFGNAAVGMLSDREAEPLQEGMIKYTSRDVRSAVGNLFQAAKNLVTLHPIKAVGNTAKAVMDGIDVPFDVALDAGSAIFDHNQKK